MINNVSCFENNFYFLHHLVDFRGLNVGTPQKCGANEVFDLYTEACRETQTILKINCTLLKLQENEYVDLNDSIYLKHLDKSINKSQFYMQQDGSFICLKHYFSFGNESGINLKMASKITESEKYLSITGFVFSIPTLFIAFSVYCYFSTLRNLPGKMAMNLMASLFLANLVFLLANIIKELPGHFLCRTFAIIAHYTYLVSFCWMNIMAFDSWQTFSRKQILSITDRSNRSFKFYMVYAWLSPVTIVAGAGVTQYLQSDSVFSPAYGDSLCWFNKRLALLIFFGLPLIIILIMNTIFFTFTFRAIYLANKFTKRCLSKSDKNTFIVFFKLYFILGINWLVSILYTFTQIELLRYISVLFTSFQGFFVGCSYLFSRKVYRQFQNKVSFFTTINSSESSCKHTAISYLGAIKSSKSF
uniref:G-protein coupled receptors family 2 profile 2 domain-containing protein n=2 Tax=Octopus bimaculoides TaxID=37653 RepID=A0A0L8FHQ6_OCTBM|eukprot:XP_014789720.1 PREDICTED: probable G-protein coupled receptor Mth-like 3 [Octopus bimaculoides]